MDLERKDNVKLYASKRAYKSLVQFHSDLYELKKTYKDDPAKLGALNDLDFEELFATVKFLAGVDYGNTIGFGAKKAAAGASETDESLL